MNDSSTARNTRHRQNPIAAGKELALAYLSPLAAALGLLLALPLGIVEAEADGRANRSDVMSVADIRPGMKGYGLTVFEGTEPSKFDVEVIDVLRNFRPRQDLILIKTAHPRLEVAKVVAGMSGSPIYIDGKMIGAYAYGWSFGSEPVAGVTPIRSMLDDLARPLPDFINGWPLRLPPHQPQRALSPEAQAALGASGPQDNRFRGAIADYDLYDHRDQIASRGPFGRGGHTAELVPVSTPLLMGGMAAESIGFAEQLLSPLGLLPLQAGGAGVADPDAPSRYVDGGAVGVQLIRGDMSAMGLGTVTRVEGDRLVGFGHPMMNAGVTSLPTTIGRVLWFLASQSRSFKLGVPARPMGAMVNDRQASIVVSHQAQAPTIPVHVKIEGVPGAPYADWNFEIAHEKFVAPSLVAVALGNAMQTTAADRQDVSWTVKSVVRIRGYGEIEVDDFGVSIGGTPDERELSRTGLVEAIGSVLSNPWEPAFVESVDVAIRLHYSRDVYRLRGAELLTPEVDAGQEARLRLQLVPYAGSTLTKTISVLMPRHLAGKSVKLSIAPGYTVPKIKPAPESLGELIANLRDPHYPPQSVVVSYEEGAGVSYRGHVAGNLPTGVVEMLHSKSSSIAPEPVVSEAHTTLALGRFLIGRESVTVSVAPVLD